MAGGGALLVVATLVALVLAARAGWLNPSYEEVRARYAGPPSTFLQVKGATLHVRDEGRGPVIVLLHGSYTNLHLWDPWVSRMKGRYRLVRLDWPAYALSTDPSGRYDNQRAVELLEGLLAAKGVKRFTLVGTSTGALIAILYAARHPDQVEALGLSTVPLFPTKATPRFDPAMAGMRWIHDRLTPGYFPRVYFKRSLRDIISVQSANDENIQDQFYYMNNLPGGYARQAKYAANLVRTFSAAADAARSVTAPVLIQWGDGDTVLLADEGDKATSAFARTHVRMTHYPGVGHYPMWEIPDRSMRDFEDFLAEVRAK